MTPQLYTASQIARALNISRQAVHKQMAAVEPAKAEPQGGCGVVKFWALNQLPSDYQRKLGELQASCGYVDKATLLTDEGNAAWQSPVPWDQVPMKYQDKAQRLMRALLPVLERRNEPGLQLTEFGLQRYWNEFGPGSIGADRWNQILQRTLKRDANRNNFRRIELYLDDKAFQAAPVVSTEHHERVREYSHDELGWHLAQVKSLIEPTAEEQARVWSGVFQHYADLLEEYPEDERGLRISLIEYIHAAMPSLSASREGMFKKFNRLYERWLEGGQTAKSVTDNRQQSGNFSLPEFTEDLDKLIAASVRYGGRISLGFRQLWKQKAFSSDFMERYAYDMRKDKSYVPKSIRDKIKHKVDSLSLHHRGPICAKAAGVSIPRNWDNVDPGQWFSGDDVTWNSYFWYQDEETGEYVVTRGECLVLVDCKTDYPLDFMLIAGKYNSRHIRSLLLRVHDFHGLPDEGFYFENGVWASSLIDGDRLPEAENVPFDEMCNGLRESALALKVRHTKARNPRSKPIEGMFHTMQEKMRGEPGFVGFDERRQKMEALQDFLSQVRRQKEHPGNELLSMEQWATRIAAHLEEFAHEPQNGKRNPGISPAENWASRIKHRPLRKLPDDARYLLSTHRKMVRVRESGISVTVSGKTYRYGGRSIAPLVGQQVSAYFNVEVPDVLTVASQDRSEFHTLRAIELPAMTATREEMKAAREAVNGHARAAKFLYGKLKHQIISTVTDDNRYSEETKDLGRFHEEAVKVVAAERQERGHTMREIRNQAKALGVATPTDVRDPGRLLEGLRLEAEARARIAAEEAAENSEQL